MAETIVKGWPNLFVVGVGRGGTTSLWQYFGQHPDVYMSPIKEPHYFSRWTPRWRDVVKDEREYLALFAAASGERWRGEASPSYVWDESVPAKIRRVSPEARIVISLREPIERAHSIYWHLVKWGLERRPFVQAVEEELEARPRLVGDDPWLTYVDRGLYAERVERYLDAYGGAVHVLFFEELAADPKRELRRAFEFLGVDPEVAADLRFDAHNRFGRPRGAVTARLIASPTATRVGQALVAPRFRRRVRSLLVTKRGRPVVDDELRARLTELYAPDREKVERLLGRSVPW